MRLAKFFTSGLVPFDDAICPAMTSAIPAGAVFITKSLSAGSSELTVPPLEPVLVVLVVPDVSVPLVSTVDVVADVSVALVEVDDVSVLLLFVSLWQAKAIIATTQTSARIHG